MKRAPSIVLLSLLWVAGPAIAQYLPRNAHSSDGQQIVGQVLQAMQEPNEKLGGSCSQIFDYVGGAITGKTTNGRLGLFRIDLAVVLHDNYGPISAGRLRDDVARFCGSPSGTLRPGSRSHVVLYALCKKFDSGWKLEQFM